MNRILCILKDMESGVTLMKDKNESKDWTVRDILRMKKKNLIKGYYVAYDNQYVIFDTSEVQYIYLIESEKAMKIAGVTDVEDVIDDESDKWGNAIPQPKWGGHDNGVMFQ